MQEVWLSLDAIFGIIGLVVGFVLHKWFTERKIGDAQSRAEALVQDAARDAETRRKTAELEAKETALKARTIFEDETRRREREIQQIEQRVLSKEEDLARKLDQLERRLTESATKDRDLITREKVLGEKEGRLASALEEQKRKLETIAGLTAEEAKRQLLAAMAGEARIEEVVEKVKKDMEQHLKDEGEKACFEVGVHGLHPELVKLVGRLKFRTSYGQNCLQHSKEVAWLAGMMAAEIRVDAKLAKRMGLLHDIGKALTHEQEGSHPQLSLQVLTKYNESPKVINAALCGHENIKPETIEAVLVQAADGVSAARPGARRDVLESYIKRLAKLEEIALSYRGVEMCYAIQAGRELRVMTKADIVSDLDAHQLAKDITKRIEAEMQYPGHIKVVVIRETRAVEVAK